MKWFFQHPNYQLGDFIMMTPGIKSISEMDGIPIPVFFGTKYISLLYKNCPFIRIIPNRPISNKAFMGTQFSSYNSNHYYKSRLNKKESMSECFFRVYATNKGYKKLIPNTYVDSNIAKVLKKENGKKYVAIFHGCLGKEFVNRKQIPTSCLQKIINTIISMNYVPVILGNDLDYNRFWNKINLSHYSIINYINKLDIKDSVSILSQCDYFVSNDTGLYHVAGALKINGLAFWGTTDFYKNSVLFDGIKRVYMKKISSFKRCVMDYLRNN